MGKGKVWEEAPPAASVPASFPLSPPGCLCNSAFVGPGLVLGRSVHQMSQDGSAFSLLTKPRVCGGCFILFNTHTECPAPGTAQNARLSDAITIRCHRDCFHLHFTVKTTEA